MRSSLIAALFVATLFGSGCSTVKGWLRPWVCECSTPTHHATVEDDIVEEHDLQAETEHDEVSQDTSPLVDATESETHDESALEAAAMDWAGPVDLATPGQQDRIKSAFLVKGDVQDGRVLVEGLFSSKGQAEVAVIDVGKSIEIYSESARVAKGAFAFEPAPKEFGEFAQAAEIVRDGRTELVTVGVQSVDGVRTVWLCVWKVIGNEIADVFQRQIAVERDGTWVRTAEVRFLTGQRNRFIEYTPIGLAGERGTAEVYRWNVWEGMFRVPRPAPTAPSRPQSMRETSHRLVTSLAFR
ncbi:MAG: hypothetical protein R3E66_08095 [bacterium]